VCRRVPEARSTISQLNSGANVVLALQTQLTQRPGVHLRDTEVGKYAMRVRKEKKTQELQSLSPGRRQESSRMPSPLNIIIWTLSTIGTILGALGTTGGHIDKAADFSLAFALV
jgi:hypothetical protein